MSRILLINSVCTGSTGSICKDIYNMAELHGHECYLAYGRGKQPIGYKSIKIGNKFDIYSHVLKTRLTDKHGFGSKRATIKFLQKLNKLKPDIIHLHNLHGYYINIELLFDYIRKNQQIKVFWTLHDCWSFTGHCAHYLDNNCYKWQYGCNECKYHRLYPKSYKDNSEYNYFRKRKCFSNLNNLDIICVSSWLKNEVIQSYLHDYNIHLIKNGIDTTIFKYKGDGIIKEHNRANKKIILGVANIWDKKKGFNDFLNLSKFIKEDMVIVLVGLSSKQLRSLPENIIGIKRVNREKLVELYSSAYVYFNPTKEETFSLTNYEAQACGTTVVTYDSGGTSETLVNENTYLIEHSIDHFLKLLDTVEFQNIKSTENLYKFEKDNVYHQYMDLYASVENK